MSGTIPDRRVTTVDSDGGGEADRAWPRGDVSIVVRDLSKRYRIGNSHVSLPHASFLGPLANLFVGRKRAKLRVKEFWALAGVTFDVVHRGGIHASRCVGALQGQNLPFGVGGEQVLAAPIVRRPNPADGGVDGARREI